MARYIRYDISEKRTLTFVFANTYKYLGDGLHANYYKYVSYFEILRTESYWNFVTRTLILKTRDDSKDRSHLFGVE